MQIGQETGVTAQVDDNRLTLFVNDSLDPGPESAMGTTTSGTDRNIWQSDGQSSRSGDTAKPNAGLPEHPSFTSQFPNQPSASSVKAGPPALQPRPDLRVSQTQGPDLAVPPQSEIQLQPEEPSFFSSIFSTTSVLIVLGLGVIGLFLARTLRKRQAGAKVKPANRPIEEQGNEEQDSGERSTQVSQRGVEPTEAPPQTAVAVSRRATGAYMTVATPDSLYGAYRIDQEVGKLVLGPAPHGRAFLPRSRRPPCHRSVINQDDRLLVRRK